MPHHQPAPHTSLFRFFDWAWSTSRIWWKSFLSIQVFPQNTYFGWWPYSKITYELPSCSVFLELNWAPPDTSFLFGLFYVRFSYSGSDNNERIVLIMKSMCVSIFIVFKVLRCWFEGLVAILIRHFLVITKFPLFNF